MKRTAAQIAIARVILDDPHVRHWGYSLRLASGIRSGVMYPILHRWHTAGLLSDGWEDPTEIRGRPPRRYYELTDHGRQELEALRDGSEPKLASHPVDPERMLTTNA